MKIFLLVFLFLGSCPLVFSQTGPGGVGASSNNAFWLDASKLNYANNASVSVFDDYSTNGNSFTQLVAANQPIFKTNAVNGLPALEFDGVNDYMRSGSIPSLESAELTWYLVYENTSNGGGIIGGSYASRVKQWLSYSITSGLNINGHYSSGSLKYAGFTQATGTFLFSGTHVTSSDIKAYRNGTLTQTRAATYVAPSGHNYVALGHIPGVLHTGLLDGSVAEAFAFSSTLNDLERVIIENYLGAKYNIAIPNDFYAYESTHKMEVIGIGDDGTDTHTNSKGAGFVRISSPGSMTSGEYLFVGHDGIEPFPLVSADMPALISATHERFNRTWRVGETGDVGTVTVTFNLGSQFGFANSSTYYILVDTDGDFSNSIATAGVYNAGTQSVSFVVNLADGDYFTLAGEPVPTNINAIADGDWSNSSTWDCSCVPTGFQNVTITGFSVDLDADGFAKDLTVAAGGSLNWTGTEKLTLKGDLEIVGTIDMLNGSIDMSGESSDQDIDLNAQSIEFNDLIINNPLATVHLLNGTIELVGILSPEDGTFDVSAGTLLVKSTSATTEGRVGEIFPTASVVGAVTVERFIASGVAGSRNISSPVIGETLAAWDNDILISGSGFPDGCAYGAFGFGDTLHGCYYSVKKHQGSNYIDVTNINEVLEPGVGYELFLGDNLSTFSGATLTTTGTLHNGTFTSPSFSFFWNLQGNPFASPISFPDLVRSHVQNYFYIYDASSGSYQWYDGATNTSSVPGLANGVIAIGQAFWTGDWGFISYPQSAKTSATATFIKSNVVENALSLTLKQENSTFFNVSTVSFREDASDDVDALDIKYLSTGLEPASSLYMVYDDTVKLTKNYLVRDGLEKVIGFKMNCKTDAYYTISPSNFADLQDYANVYIFDKFLNKTIDLVREGQYTFYAEEGDLDRFTLILTNSTLSDKTYMKGIENSVDSNVSLAQLGQTIEVSSTVMLNNVTLEVTNVLGQKVFSDYQLAAITGKQYVSLPSELNGMYIVVLRENGNIMATKKIIL
jgi:hypothetical protein